MVLNRVQCLAIAPAVALMLAGGLGLSVIPTARSQTNPAVIQTGSPDVDDNRDSTAELEEADAGTDPAIASTANLELDVSVPLAGVADRLDWMDEPSLAAVGILEAQTIAVVDLDAGETVWQIPVGFAPHVVRYDPQRRLIFAAGIDSAELVAIDVAARKIQQVYQLPAGTFDLALDSQNGRLFATHPANRTFSVIDLKRQRARSLALPGSPLAIAFNPETERLLVSLGDDETLGLLAIDAESGELLARLKSGSVPEGMALDVVGQRLVLLNSGSSDLTVINLRNYSDRPLTVGLDWRPTRLALSADGSRAYITSRDSDRLQVVNLDSGQIEATYVTDSQPTGIVTVADRNASGNEGEVAIVAAGVPALQRVRLNQASSTSAVVIPAVTGSVAGRVVNVAGAPVRAGEIRLSATTAPNRDRRLNLLPDGSFFIPALPAGTYLADVTAENYPPMSTQIQVRAGFISSQIVRMPPGRADEAATGIGVLPDSSPFSDELASRIREAISTETVFDAGEAALLVGPLGPAPEFAPVLPALRDIQLIDGDERFTADLERLKAAGNALGLRYILLTRMEVSTDFNRAGNPWLNVALQYFVPALPVTVPNFTPNQLRSRGIITLVDLQTDRPGDRATYFEAFGRDDVGGAPMFDEAAAGLYRQQVRNMVPEFLRQWQEQPPFS
ncbi:MAG: hypothetical protein AAFY57_05350 [Cyanobacteria bacterium J06642_2]